MASYQIVKVPQDGQAIRMGSDGKLQVPNDPILPFIEGDGTGPDIWRASQRVLDAAVAKAYGGRAKMRGGGASPGGRRFEGFKGGFPARTAGAFAKIWAASKGRR